MFSDRDIAYASSNDSLSYSEPDLSPASTLFSSGSPWDLSASTSGRGSISSMEPDDMSFGTSSYSNPAGIQDEFFSMAEGMNDTIPVFMDQNLLFPSNYNKLLSDQSMLGYSTLTGYDEPAYDSFDIQSSIQNAQTSLDLDIYSQMSSIGSPSLSMNFVVPSQTTFAERYDLQTPLRELKPLPVSSSDSSNGHNAITYPPDDDDKFRMMPPRSCPAPRLRPSPTRKPAFESLQTSLDLQSAPTDKYGMRHLRKQRARRGSNTVPTVPSHVRIQNKAIKKCEWPGCNGRFQRQEHLKRHEKTHINAETYICRFCNRPFGRSDNLKSHTRLHTKKTPRTQYFPEALEVYEEMSRKPRKARDSILGGAKRASETGLSKPSLRSQASV